jgi:GxxExxY protein
MDVFDFRRRGDAGVGDDIEALAAAVIGAAIEVHRELGPGMPELSYKLALSYELGLRGIPYQLEVPLPITYKGKPVGETRIDILVAGKLVLELKAVESLTAVHKAQLLTYLQLTKLKLGVLINFNVPLLKDGIKRVINPY